MIMKVFTINYLIIGNTFDNDFTFHSLIFFANTGCKKIKNWKTIFHQAKFTAAQDVKHEF